MAKKAYQSHAAAIDRVAETVQRENIACHFTRINGYLFAHPTDSHDTLEKELHTAEALGIPLTRMDDTPHIE